MAFLILWLLASLVLAIVALVRTGTLERRLHEIERKLEDLKRPASPVQIPTPVKPAAAAPGPLPVPLSASPKPAQPTPISPAGKTVPAAPVRPTRSKEEWEALIGGKLLNRVGAVALILGVAFFLKYAFDRNWISELIRVLIGAFVGGSLLVIAARSKRRGLMIFAQGLVGAGIAILYLTVYAAFQVYELTSQPVAFVLMSGVTVLAFLQAFAY